MKDGMPTLKEIFDSDNKPLQENLLQFVMMYSLGYTMEDFKAFADEMLADDDVKETVEITLPLFKYALKGAVGEING